MQHSCRSCVTVNPRILQVIFINFYQNFSATDGTFFKLGTVTIKGIRLIASIKGITGNLGLNRLTSARPGPEQKPFHFWFDLEK